MTEKSINTDLAETAKQVVAAQTSASALAQSALATYQPKLALDPYGKLRPASYLGPAAQAVVRIQTTGLQRTATAAVASMTKHINLTEILGLNRPNILGGTSVGLGIKPIGLDLASIDHGFKAMAAQSFVEPHSASYFLLD